MDSKRTFLLWTLITFKNNFMVFLNELGMSNEEIEKKSTKRHNEYMKFFETIRDLLIENLIEKKMGGDVIG